MKRYAPGIYDISNADYHSSQGLSRSALMKLKKSPLHYAAHYKYGVGDKSPTPAMKFGSAVHSYILEPDKFDSQYLVVDKIEGRSKKAMEEREALELEAAGREVIWSETMNEIMALSDAFHSHEVASQFLGNAKVEQSLFWRDEFTQVLLKCRPDIWAPEMIIDLKTTNDASPDSIQRDIASYGYHIQAAMIIDGIKAVTEETIKEFVLLAIEKKPPYAVGMYAIGEHAIEVGRNEYLDLVNCYKRHEENNEWPSYQSMTLHLPNYY